MNTRVLLSLALLVGGCDLAAPMASRAGDVADQAVQTLVPPAWADQTVLGTNRIADVAEQAVQSVVHVKVKKDVSDVQAEQILRMFGERVPPGGLPIGAGSGVIVDAAGLIVTNHHVVAVGDAFEVTLHDGRTFDAKVKATDADTDVAILELVGDAVPDDLPALRFGDSDAARLGEVVLAIGSPMGEKFRGSVTLGIISARGRSRLQGLSRYQDYLQTDAAINMGNSGGALVNLEGELVGVPSALASAGGGGYDGVSLAIPSNLVQDVVSQLLQAGRVSRGYLGVGIGDVNPAIAEALGLPAPMGAIVGQIAPGSAAERAGLQTYDVITAIDGKPIEDAADLGNTVGLKAPGTSIQVDVVRDGRTKALTAVLDERASDEATAEPASGSEQAPDEGPGGLLEGVRVADPGSDAAQAVGAGPDTAGAVVVEVAGDSAAALAGIRPGDVILQAERKPVASAKELAQRLKGKDQAMLLVSRDGFQRIVVLLAD